MAKKTIFRLPFSSDFRIMGLFCSERDYRMAWLINRTLDFSLVRVDDFPFTAARGEDILDFSVYHHHSEYHRVSYFLVNNRSSDGIPMFLTPPRLDFLLLIRTDDHRFDTQLLLTELRNIRQISATVALYDELGRRQDSFLYDFEMFADQVSETGRNDLMWPRPLAPQT